MFEALIASVVVMVVSLIGVLFAVGTARVWLEARLPFLISFSAGVFLITAGAIALETFHIVDAVWQGALFIVAGYVLAWSIHVLLPETHHHHDTDCGRRHGPAARKIIIGDGIHNLADGVILVAAFMVSPALGIAVTVSIVIHEALQEVSEFFVLRQAGYSTKQALAINFAVSSTVLLGVLLGYFALVSHDMEAILLGVSAGFFLHVVAHDLLPKRHQHASVGLFGKHVLLVLVGALLMGLIASTLSEGHEHGHGGNEHTEEHHDEHHNENTDRHDNEHHDEHEDETWWEHLFHRD